MKNKIFTKKITHWEHWPTSMFYIPNLPYAFYLAFKAKHTAFFTAANPGIKSSGNGTESKYEITQLIPQKYRPNSILVLPNTSFNTINEQLQKAGIQFPLIAKPDIGFRGLLVQKIATKEALELYLKNYPINIIIQEFLDYKNECGVFYHRKPGSKQGKITSLTLKHFIFVTGDGYSTLEELILNHKRAHFYIHLFKEIHHKDILSIPKKNETIKLTAIGNHAKGTQFIDGNHLISKKLEQTLDTISNAIDGWYYGRVDIKYDDFESLENGINFKVLEINGILAEPTHIYDGENNNYFKALKAIRTHWGILYDIATTNHIKYNIPYKSSKKFINEIIGLRNYVSSIKKM